VRLVASLIYSSRDKKKRREQQERNKISNAPNNSSLFI